MPDLLAMGLESLAGAEGPGALLALALALVLGCLGFPVPEEAIHATAGWLVALGRVPWWAAWLTGWGVLVLLDLALFELGRRQGPRVRRSRWGRRIPSGRWRAARLYVRGRGTWAVGAARFVMGVRIPIFVLAGALGLARRRFLLVVAPLGLVSSGIPLWLGYAFSRELPRLIEALGAARWLLLWAFLLLVLGLVGLGAWRRRAAARGAPPG